MSAPHYLNLLAMNPNKRGPVEYQLVEMARRVREQGGMFSCAFTTTPPEWYADLLADAGASAFVIDPERWSERIIELALELKPSLAHFHFGNHWPAAATLSRAGIRVIRTEHSFMPCNRLRLHRVIVRRLRAREVVTFIAVSDYIRRQTQRAYFVPRRRVFTILNGIDLELFRPRNDRNELREQLGLPEAAFIVTTAAHLHPQKRIDLLIRAFPDVLRSIPKAWLVVAGGGSELPRLEELVARLELGPRVFFLTGDNAVNRIYGASDVAVLTSAGEGMPGSAMEALACGLPLVATPCGGLREVAVDGKSGIYVESANQSDLAAAITQLALDHELRRRIGNAGRKRAEQLFDVRRTAAETIGLYEDVVA